MSVWVVSVSVVSVCVPPPSPFETLMRTVSPSPTSSPAGGFCATTWPAGASDGTSKTFAWRPTSLSSAFASSSLSPTRSGTSTRPVPLETLTCTGASASTRSPAAGLWATTTPTGSSEKTRRTSACRPASSSRSSASSSGSPTTFGTLAVAAPVETSRVTSSPSSSCVPAPGSVAKT